MRLEAKRQERCGRMRNSGRNAIVQSQVETGLALKNDGGREAYRGDIDGLRALAVTGVVLYHAGVRALAGGFVGVDVFFVISGYLIGAHVYREAREGSFSLARFYQRRAKRILPALLLVLWFCYVAGMLLLTPADLKVLAQYALTTIGSASNVLASRRFDYFAKAAIENPLLMTWSLGVEEQFYVGFPLLMMALAWWVRRRKTEAERERRMWMGVAAGMALLSLGLSVWMTSHARMQAFFLLPARGWELAVGVWMAMYEAGEGGSAGTLYGGARLKEMRGAAGLAMVVGAMLSYGPATVFPGMGALLPVAGTALVLSAPGAWGNRRLLGSAALRWVGLLSYSWYLWHWPLLSFASIAVAGPLRVGTALAVVLVALGVAWMSYRWVEQPFRRSLRKPWPLLWRYAAVCALLALPAVMMKRTGGLPGRYPAVSAQAAELMLDPEPCFGGERPNAAEVCLPKLDGRAAVALLGDSHAAALAPELRELAGAAQRRLLTVTHVSCPPVLGVVRQSVDVRGDGECARFTEAAVRMLSEDASVQTVVLAALWAGPVYDPPGFGYVRGEDRGEVDVEAECGQSSRRAGGNGAKAARGAEARGADRRCDAVGDRPGGTCGYVPDAGAAGAGAAAGGSKAGAGNDGAGGGVCGGECGGEPDARGRGGEGRGRGVRCGGRSVPRHGVHILRRWNAAVSRPESCEPVGSATGAARVPDAARAVKRGRGWGLVTCGAREGARGARRVK